ncbi:hypothetical protein F5Y05DRAFT_364808 [Hypoxylon sp. FL0543]|nr:hypothetical protein F5Y05DRAFT_364808 [Hypoxylon sp. FL0543]
MHFSTAHLKSATTADLSDAYFFSTSRSKVPLSSMLGAIEHPNRTFQSARRPRKVYPPTHRSRLFCYMTVPRMPERRHDRRISIDNCGSWICILPRFGEALTSTAIVLPQRFTWRTAKTTLSTSISLSDLSQLRFKRPKCLMSSLKITYRLSYRSPGALYLHRVYRSMMLITTLHYTTATTEVHREEPILDTSIHRNRAWVWVSNPP